MKKLADYLLLFCLTLAMSLSSWSLSAAQQMPVNEMGSTHVKMMDMATDADQAQAPQMDMDMDCEHCETMSFCHSGYGHCTASPALLNQVIRPTFIPGPALVNMNDASVRLSSVQTSLYRPPISA